MQKSNYYKGLVQGLDVGIQVVKEVLEQGGVSQDDLLESYNKMINESYLAYQKMQEEESQLDIFGSFAEEQYFQLQGGKQ